MCLLFVAVNQTFGPSNYILFNFPPFICNPDEEGDSDSQQENNRVRRSSQLFNLVVVKNKC